jgi:translation initiation factor IF-3
LETVIAPFVVVGGESFKTTRLVDTKNVFHERIKIEDALSMADEEGLDLVCFADSDSDNPLCKMIDFGKWKYNQGKKKKKLQKEQKHQVKEVRFTPLITDNDLKHKIKHVKQMVEHDCEVILSMRIKSRQNKQTAQIRMDEIVDQCAEFSSTVSEKKTNNALMVRISKKK